MKIQDRYLGKDFLFEGKRTVLLNSIPVGAKILSAKLTVTPVNSGGKQIMAHEVVSFSEGSNTGTIDNQLGYATKKTVNSSTDSSGWVEVDFHGRRTLVSVIGSDTTLDNASLQVDIGGGSFIEINENGAFKGPENNPFILKTVDLPGLTVNRIKLTGPSTTPHTNPDINSITISSSPDNVSLALGELPTFWMHMGEMTGSQTTPDFRGLLQSVLLEADSENGFYKIPVILHSDSLARLDLDFDIDYQQQVDVLPHGLSEVKLPYDYNGTPQAEFGLLTISLPANARVLPKETRAQVIGTFNAERIAQGPIGEVDTDISVDISPQNTQAHLITIDENVTGTAFDFLLEPVDELVRLQLDLRENLDGKPGSASLLPEPVNFSLDGKTAPGKNWHNVKLPQGFRFEDHLKTKRLWVIIQSLTGHSQWITKATNTVDVGMVQSKDGGLSWRETLINGARMSAQYRLRNTPVQFTVPIHLQVGENEQALAVALDRFQALGRVDFNLDFDEVAETINQYLDDTSTKLCPEIEHLANGDFSQRDVSNLDKPLPVDWELTMGDLSFEENSGVLLGNMNFENVTGLSQVVPVAAGCHYQLEILAGAQLEGAVVEIIWLGSECGIAQVNQLSIPLLTDPGISTNPSLVINIPSHSKALRPKRARFKAPDDATQAELRIKVPEDNKARIESISFLATQEAISNTDLREIDIFQHSFQDWEIKGEKELLQPSPDQGLVNNSVAKISFIQLVSALENKPFAFAFKGSTTSAANPSIELHWRNNDGVSSLSPIIEIITADNLEHHLLEGNVPAGINQLEVRLILAPEANLKIENVSFLQPERVDVPLNLIAQAPGELTLSNVQIAYEKIEPKALEIPENGLCYATPADSEPGDVCEQKCICPVCHGETEIADVEIVRTPANRPAIVARCENCNSEISRLGGRLDSTARMFPDRRSIMTVTRTLPLDLPKRFPGTFALNEPEGSLGAEIVSEATGSVISSVKEFSLTDIKGIGTVRMSLLEQQGLGSRELLAQANTGNLAKILKISPHQAKDIINQAAMKSINNK